MRYAVRALGWATKILWILIIVFAATSVYSAVNVKMGFGEPKIFLSSDSVVMSVPFFVNNTGLYELSELNMTVTVMDSNGSLVSTSTTFVPSIPRGSFLEMAHNVSISLNNFTSQIQDYLFNSTVFDLGLSLKLNFARAIPFHVSTNMTMPLRAPLYNLSIGRILTTTSTSLVKNARGPLVMPHG